MFFYYCSTLVLSIYIMPSWDLITAFFSDQEILEGKCCNLYGLEFGG